MNVYCEQQDKPSLLAQVLFNHLCHLLYVSQWISNINMNTKDFTVLPLNNGIKTDIIKPVICKPLPRYLTEVSQTAYINEEIINRKQT
jgi:hypothetical protein